VQEGSGLAVTAKVCEPPEAIDALPKDGVVSQLAEGDAEALKLSSTEPEGPGFVIVTVAL